MDAKEKTVLDAGKKDGRPAQDYSAILPHGERMPLIQETDLPIV